MKQHPKTLEFIEKLITDLNLECDIQERSPGYVVNVRKDRKFIAISFSKDGIIDDLEIAINEHGRGYYYSTVKNNLKFWIYLKLGTEGFIPDLCISDELINEKRSWRKNYRCSLSFNDQMTTALIDGIRFMAETIDSLVEEYGSLNLGDVEEERKTIGMFIAHYNKIGHLNESGASASSIGYLKAAAIFKIIELEKAKKKTRIRKVIQALDKKIYHIVYRLREEHFADARLPEIIYTIKEYIYEKEGKIQTPKQTKPSVIDDQKLQDLNLQDSPGKFDVAFSLAHEQHQYVDKVFEYLDQNAKDLKVFYYRDEGQEIILWGKNQIEHLQKVYRDLSTHVIIFISADYVKKRWAKHEWHSVQEAILDRPEEYLLPARFDNTELPGLHKTINYIDLSNKTPDEFAKMIFQKIQSLKE